MKEKHLYICDVCGTEWQDKAQADACEATALPPCPVAVGDAVEVYHRYGPPGADVVVGVTIGATYEAACAAARPDAPLMYELVQRHGHHEWTVETRNYHAVRKDESDRTHPLRYLHRDGVCMAEADRECAICGYQSYWGRSCPASGCAVKERLPNGFCVECLDLRARVVQEGLL